MPTRRKLAIAAQINTHREGARIRTACLIRADLLRRTRSLDIPHIDFAIMRRHGQHITSLTQPKCPRLAWFGSELATSRPLGRIVVPAPNLNRSVETGAGDDKAIARSAEVVATERVGIGDGLFDWKAGLGAVMGCYR